VICGTRGDPDTVAPFRAWRGSRDLVAQSPKFHAPAAAHFRAAAGSEFNTQKFKSRHAGIFASRDSIFSTAGSCCASHVFV
jgi:hypothetical protein